MRHIFFNPTVILVCCLVLLAAGCRKDNRVGEALTPRAIYHWKTTYNPTPWEQEFLKEHKIGRIYLHLFDVDAVGDDDVAPVATLRFGQPLPDGIEVVPTVFVSHEALDVIDNSFRLYSSDIADKIYDRVSAMMRCQGVSVKEIQIDCDGGMKCSHVVRSLVESLVYRAHEDSIKVSSTLRLSQLVSREGIPRCDGYVLMLYNTGQLQNFNTRNSILDYADVEPYLKYITPSWLDSLRDDGARLDCAYPLYGWGVAFHPSGRFAHLVQPTDLPETGNDTLRVEWAQMSDIHKVQKAVGKRMPSGYRPAAVLYHLDSANLSRYSFNEIETVLNH